MLSGDNLRVLEMNDDEKDLIACTLDVLEVLDILDLECQDLLEILIDAGQIDEEQKQELLRACR